MRRENQRDVVHLAGHLSEAQVPDLLATVMKGLGIDPMAAEPPVLELDELMSADVVGIDALLRVEQRGAQLVGLLEYLRFELETLARKSQR